MTKSITIVLSGVLLGAVLASAAGDAKTEKEVLAALDVWKQAMMKKDGAAFEKVLHEKLLYGHSNGMVETKAEAIKHVVAGAAAYEAIDFADTVVRSQGNTAVASGKVEMRQNTGGKVSTVRLVVLTVWVKGPQGWQMIGRQATRPPQ